MLKKLICFIFFFCICSSVSAKNGDSLLVSNDYFSFVMPKETKNTFIVQKIDNGINIIEKFSAKADEGGFAFGLAIYNEPKDYADMEDYRKIGELIDKNGKLYDMVLIKPVELRYADGKSTAEHFQHLYDSAENVEIKGVNGSKYFKNQGVKGEYLYSDILSKYNTAIKEGWSYSKYKEEDMGAMYVILSKNKNLQNKIGYAFYDINSDGIDELFIGEVKNGNQKGIIYDVYTMVDRKPAHVISIDGTDEHLFITCDKYLWREISKDVSQYNLNISVLKKNSIVLVPYVAFGHNSKLKKNKSYSVTYGQYGSREYVSKKEFNERKSLFCDYKRLDYTPLSKFK